ncbi:F-box protein At5g52880 [Lotus japonicus]|uniref:F-box protein At5g52880 n=1 Tax=Lotus japonicus TaxID=34305 RepID=UPI002585AE28|nr:F-box protein At5g52880 [Lotus japonicus]
MLRVLNSLSPLQRYYKLRIEESLRQPYRYIIVCKELTCILKEAYPHSPKNLQSLIFQDTLTAFRLLPEIQTQNAVSAVHLLLQSAQATLPKQKRNMAISEYKNAIVSYKRRSQAHHHIEDGHVEEGSFELPRDILENIFSSLDMQSLVSAGLVCRSWSVAANDNHLWELQYGVLFGAAKQRATRLVENRNSRLFSEPIDSTTITDWKEAVKKAYNGSLSKKLSTNRGYCEHCETVVWLNNSKCPNVWCGRMSRNQNVKQLTTLQVVEYILNDSLSITSSSDSDSDSEEEGPVSRLWAYPKHIGL